MVIMKSVLLISIPLCLFVFASMNIRLCHASQQLLCLVCRSVVEEIESDIQKVDPRKTIEVGSFRINANGDQTQAKVPYAGSETHLHEVLENVCSRMDEYAQAKYKDTGEHTIIKLTGSDGAMNPVISKVDLLPDTELNSKLKFYCETIVEEHEDDIIRIFTKQLKEPDLQLCSTVAGYCPDYEDDDGSYEFERDEL